MSKVERAVSTFCLSESVKLMKKIDETFLKKVIVKRPLGSHKGDYGRLLLIGGVYPYAGAIVMAALAAVHSGAGLVMVATDDENIPALHNRLPESMAFDLFERWLFVEQVTKADVVLIGPGLVDGEPGEIALKRTFEQIQPHQVLILDGGALTILAETKLELPQAQIILTPHQKEWERLSGLALDQQTEEKTREALESLFPAGTILVQKGNGTRIWQAGQEDFYQLEVGGPYQATGGMGDTLAGMIAGFAGQFPQVSLYERVVAATHLHSAIAEELSQEAYVVLPTSISREIPRVMKTISH